MTLYDDLFKSLQEKILNCLQNNVSSTLKTNDIRQTLKAVTAKYSRPQIKLLIEDNKDAHSPLSVAIENGNLEALEFFFHYIDFSSINSTLVFNLFKLIIDRDNWNFLRILVKKVENIDSRDADECSVLGYAIKSMKIKAIRILMERGADINDTRMIINTRFISRTENNSAEDGYGENGDRSDADKMDIKYVHPVVYTAAKGNRKLMYYFLNCEKVPFGEKMNAVEVFGARHAFRTKNTEMAFNVWENAILCRYYHPELNGNPVPKENVASFRNILLQDSFTEPATVKDIHMFHQKAFQTSISYEFMVSLVWAFLVFERTCGYNPELTFESFNVMMQYFRDQGMDYTNINALSVFSKEFFYALSDKTSPRCKIINEDGDKKEKSVYDALLYYLGEDAVMKIGSEISEADEYGDCSIYRDDFDTQLALSEAILDAGYIGGEPVVYPCSTHSYLLVMLDYLMKCRKHGDSTAKYDDFMKKVVMSDPRCNHMESLLHKAVRLIRSNRRWFEFYIGEYRGVPECGNPELVDTLLSLGADANATDQDCNTPLHSMMNYIGKQSWKNVGRAVYRKTIKLLKDNGAQVDSVNKNGETPLSLASKHDSKHQLAELLQSS